MRKVKAWVQPNYSPSAIWVGSKKGSIQTVIFGYCTPEPNRYNIAVSGPSLLKRLSGKRKGKRFAATHTQIIKPLKLSYLKLLPGAPTQWIATLIAAQPQTIRYKARVKKHEAIAYPDHINLNEIPRNSAILFRCGVCGKSVTRFKRSNRINYPHHCGAPAYIEKVTYAGITLYQLGIKEKTDAPAYKIRVNAPLPKPHTLKRHYDEIPEYYNNHFEKSLTFNPNRINISTLGYIKPLTEITDYDRLTVITK